MNEKSTYKILRGKPIQSGKPSVIFICANQYHDTFFFADYYIIIPGRAEGVAASRITFQPQNAYLSKDLLTLEFLLEYATNRAQAWLDNYLFELGKIDSLPYQFEDFKESEVLFLHLTGEWQNEFHFISQRTRCDDLKKLLRKPQEFLGISIDSDTPKPAY